MKTFDYLFFYGGVPKGAPSGLAAANYSLEWK
jgi:hypothetical protein